MPPRSSRQSALALAGAALLALTALGASAPRARLDRERAVSPDFRQGLARFGQGWVFSGDDGLWRTGDDGARRTRARAPAIPPEWRARGYSRVGDVDVAGVFLYAAWEQPDLVKGEQAMARYDARTLAFVDAVTVPQHENPFVAVDARRGIAYAVDRATDDRLLQYDLGHDWRPAPSIPLATAVPRLRGADALEGYLYLSTDDEENGLYQVDLGNGEVDPLGSAGHVGGTGGGLDATALGSGRLHTVTVDADGRRVWFAHFDVPGPARTGALERVLVGATVLATAAAIVVVVVVTRRSRPSRRSPTGQP